MIMQRRYFTLFRLQMEATEGMAEVVLTGATEGMAEMQAPEMALMEVMAGTVVKTVQMEETVAMEEAGQILPAGMVVTGETARMEALMEGMVVMAVQEMIPPVVTEAMVGITRPE